MGIKEKVSLASEASKLLGACSREVKDRGLRSIAEGLRVNRASILAANERDLRLAREADLAGPMLKRLVFDESKLSGVIAGVESLIALDDPVGKILRGTELDNGLELYQVTCPIGVVGVIFEARPDALVQISTLCLKSGNAAVLKGGSEALHTNRELARVIAEATKGTGVPEGWLQLLETRSDVGEMLKLDGLIDLIVPRGSNEFVKYIMDNTNIAVMGHADGICHVYVDESADEAMAVDVVVDSKCQYVSVCNACETLLVHAGIAKSVLPKLVDALRKRQVRLLGCPVARSIVEMEEATDADWDTEYLDYVLSIKVVPSLDDAIDHINRHGSGHTDVIVASDETAAERFMALVDSADVFWNCSSRFADGFRFGLGAEVGISTNKIHARGPVGLEGLVIYKYRLKGQGHVVADYAEGRRQFTHVPIVR